MRLLSAAVLCLVLAQTVLGATIDHDKVQPFAQPDPVTIAEKAAVKFKPQLLLGGGCGVFPAVNAAGEITGGLKGTNRVDGCTESPLGAQVYGRSTWYQDKWAIMYAWYFPKNFCSFEPESRHLWSNVVLWLDNPALETPTILAASFSRQTLKVPTIFFMPLAPREEHPYVTVTEISPRCFVDGSNVSTRLLHGSTKSCWIGLGFSSQDGQYQDLIMWDQLTDQARAALESADFGEDTKVPFNDKNFDSSLAEAFPF
ncbi:hypothetical protein P3T76_010351 [Phytophthora citrophthora]|uniref:Necrosis inducing-like protein NPP1 type n=1 Tax=Phytophthora citrophthora TaxID=4793 RepID=A0AAD9GC68_9STRA|nr:hypothetical protein P3T76_010351 [Phytophthora citrophthora]